MMRLIVAVLIVGAADESHVFGGEGRKAPIFVGNDRAVGIRFLEEAAGAGEAFDGGVGIDVKPGNERGTVHNQPYAGFAVLRFVENRLKRRGVVGTAAFFHVGIENGYRACQNFLDFHCQAARGP